MKKFYGAVEWKHGMSKTRPYRVWAQMLQRCQNPKQEKYRYYGGCGISVCDRWKVFSNFWYDMGAAYKIGLTIDRIDLERGYSKANCRWVTQTAQNRNKSNNRLIQTPWGVMSLAEAAERSGVRAKVIWDRLVRYKWPMERVLEPVRRIYSLDRKTWRTA